MRPQELKKDISSFLLYVFGFLLLWEWLRPLEQLTDTDNIVIFIIFILLSFLMAYTDVNKWAQLFIKSLYIVYGMYHLFFEGGFFNFQWWGSFLEDLKGNTDYLLDANWYEMTSAFRSLLFFILLWLMTYLIQYWLLKRQRIFIFFFMTLIYITILDTFTPYRANTAIVRTIIIGFAVMGMLTFYRLLVKEKVVKEKSHSSKWMIPLAIMIGVSAGIGFIAPKAAPIWPDPVPYLKSYSEQSGSGSSIKKIGYGTNDEQLGGPFIGDDSVVYRVEATDRNYWKVETKDEYTGKGWVAAVNGERQPFVNQETVPLETFVSDTETSKSFAEVMSYMEYPHIAYPLGVKTISVSPDSRFELDREMEKIYSFDGANRPTVLDQYAVNYEIPRYSVKELIKNPESGTVIDDESLSRYTQLPEGLPDRVKQLAREITVGKTNWFDQAREIEKYFDRSEFSYDQKNVAVPDEDEDYVDQFLFETKKGYCDNFSTSMVVLLRAVGIPARWVKGYSDGEFMDYADDNSGRRIFEITNNNAHSWVEVYFPNQGWVTFEPTKGFDNDASFNFDEDNDGDKQSAATPPVPAKKSNQDRLNKLERDTKTEKKSFSLKDVWLETKTFIKSEWNWILFILIAVVGCASYVYSVRGKWLPHYFLYIFKYRKKDANFGVAYLVLLKQLDRFGLKRKKHQTLREYALYIDNFFSSREMSRLTLKYEQFVYKQNLVKGSWVETRELWENLIKKTIA
jgi:transglutaminase-like putative cysteine protease